AGPDDTGWHYRALEGTQGHSLDGGPPPEIFLWACGHLAELSHAAQSLFSGPTGTVRSQPPSGRIPADAYGQPRITTYNSSLLLLPGRDTAGVGRRRRRAAGPGRAGDGGAVPGDLRAGWRL